MISGIFVAASLVGFASLATAQSNSSFNFANITGVQTLRSGNIITLNVSSSATLTYNTVT